MKIQFPKFFLFGLAFLLVGIAFAAAGNTSWGFPVAVGYVAMAVSDIFFND